MQNAGSPAKATTTEGIPAGFPCENCGWRSPSGGHLWNRPVSGLLAEEEEDREKEEK